MDERCHCICCGYKTLVVASEGTIQECPVCALEYIWMLGPWPKPLIEDGNEMLHLYRLYETKGSIHVQRPGEAERVPTRPPRPEEPRADGWVPWTDRFRAAGEPIIERVHVAFKDVQLGGGTSLGDAYARSCYRDGDPNAARHERWQDVTLDEVDRFTDFHYLDEEGWRFYLPAAIVHFLNHHDCGSEWEDDFIWNYPIARSKPRVSGLDAAQLTCAYAFLGIIQEFFPRTYGSASS